MKASRSASRATIVAAGLLSIVLTMVMGTTAFQAGQLRPCLSPSRAQQKIITTTTCLQGASPSSIDDEEYISPNQIKILRKEVAKRRARKKLTKFKMPEDESYGDFTDETLGAIIELLAKNEVVEVRGISRDRKRNVFATTEQLAMDLSSAGEKFVTVVEIKGFVATLYCPGDDDVEKKIIRRTSYREGQWTKKPKPKRDNRGQIIEGEYEYFG